MDSFITRGYIFTLQTHLVAFWNVKAYKLYCSCFRLLGIVWECGAQVTLQLFEHPVGWCAISNKSLFVLLVATVFKFSQNCIPKPQERLSYIKNYASYEYLFMQTQSKNVICLSICYVTIKRNHIQKDRQNSQQLTQNAIKMDPERPF